MPWGSRNRTRAAAQSHTVVGPLAAITGTRFRFAIATMERKVRSQTPSARLSGGRTSISSSAADAGRRARGPFLLGGGERGGDLLEYLEMVVDVLIGMLHRDGPLLIPPIGLRENAAIDHGEPIVSPHVLVDVVPVAIVAYAPRVQQQRAVGTGAIGVRDQAGLPNDALVSIHQLAVQTIDLRI